MRKIIKLPVLLMALFMGFMFILDSANVGYDVEIPGNGIISLVFVVAGLLIIATGGYLFRSVNTTVNPVTPEQTTQLVTTGVYHYSRNPMYMGFLMWLLAFAIFIGNLINLLLLPLYIQLVNSLYIFPEEMALEKRFGNEFREYRKRVRRWI
jgi:protein-S-isoprenylcysteine O-methyltransferase Ste14